MNRNRGMTMIELMVSLAIVMLVIGTATTAYLKLLRSYRTQGRLAESYMANLAGLELLRYDIETAGFGLPANINGINYTEAAAAAGTTIIEPYNPASLNDSNNTANGNNNVPRALRAFRQSQSGFSGGNNYAASDVLSIKSCSANINSTSKKWSMISNVSGVQPKVKAWGGTANLDPVMDFTNAPNPDFLIALDSNGKLVTNAGTWAFQFNSASPTQGFYSGASGITGSNNLPDQGHVYYMYGLDNNAGAHNMPFNRVDYYLASNPNAPSSCAQNTLTLYRSTVLQTGQNGGGLSATPLIDCVRDFQVAFGIDTDPSGNVTGTSVQWQSDLRQNALFAAGINGAVNNAQMTAAQIQQYLREVRVFVLYSEGLGDTSSASLASANTNSNFRFTGTLTLGNSNGVPQLSTFTPTGAQQQYRWKIIEIDVKPNNLLNLPNTIGGIPVNR